MTGERRRSPGRRVSDRRWVIHVRENWYRDVWLFLITVVVVLIAVKALSVSSRADANQRVDTAALCTLRADLQARISSSERFLAHHPHGFAGVSALTIRTGIANEQRTITALSTIRCNH